MSRPRGNVAGCNDDHHLGQCEWDGSNSEVSYINVSMLATHLLVGTKYQVPSPPSACHITNTNAACRLHSLPLPTLFCLRCRDGGRGIKELNALLRTVSPRPRLQPRLPSTANSHLGKPGCPGRAYLDWQDSRFKVPSSGYRRQTMSNSA